MKLDFDYKWYKATCQENDLNPNHDLAMYFLKKAKEQSKRMKYYMDALESYKDDKKATSKIQAQIEYHNNKRIENMLDALKAAEGKGLD